MPSMREQAELYQMASANSRIELGPIQSLFDQNRISNYSGHPVKPLYEGGSSPGVLERLSGDDVYSTGGQPKSGQADLTQYHNNRIGNYFSAEQSMHERFLYNPNLN
jgi:hypothetical protein